LPPADFHCLLLSLPHVFGTTLDTIPAKMPYLSADASATARWRARTATVTGIRVGLAWAGEPRPQRQRANLIDQRRSIPLNDFAAFAELPGVSFVSLQKGEAAGQTRSPPPGLLIHDWTDEIHDFTDTAALIDALDLIITVDTAVAHLAGALSKPIWLLNRFDSCWRWLLARDESPWYPSLRQFRQPRPGDWEAVIRDVRGALSQLSGARVADGGSAATAALGG